MLDNSSNKNILKIPSGVGTVTKRIKKALATKTVSENNGKLSIHKIEIRKKIFEQCSGHFIELLQGYVETLNQIGLVSTLLLGTTVGLFASLIGHWWDGEASGISEWKLDGFVIFSVFSSLCSLLTTVQSFLLSIEYTLKQHVWLCCKERLCLNLSALIDDRKQDPTTVVIFPGSSVTSSEKDIRLDRQDFTEISTVSFPTPLRLAKNIGMDMWLVVGGASLSLLLFPLTLLFGFLVTMSGNDFGHRTNNTESRWVRNVGPGLVWSEILVIVACILTFLYILFRLCCVICGICGNDFLSILKGARIGDWAKVLNNESLFIEDLIDKNKGTVKIGRLKY